MGVVKCEYYGKERGVGSPAPDRMVFEGQSTTSINGALVEVPIEIIEMTEGSEGIGAPSAGVHAFAPYTSCTLANPTEGIERQDADALEHQVAHDAQSLGPRNDNVGFSEGDVERAESSGKPAPRQSKNDACQKWKWMVLLGLMVSIILVLLGTGIVRIGS
jgi:hypothetical protein